VTIQDRAGNSLFFVGLALLTFAAPALSDDEAALDAIEAFRQELQFCKSSPSQEIGFELKVVSGQPVSVPATKEELARVKELLEKSSMPYDPVNHRATYEVVLALVRARNVAVFKVNSEEGADLSAVRQCLTRLASESGLESKFE
jgi:hypothetical protein